MMTKAMESTPLDAMLMLMLILDMSSNRQSGRNSGVQQPRRRQKWSVTSRQNFLIALFVLPHGMHIAVCGVLCAVQQILKFINPF